MRQHRTNGQHSCLVTGEGARTLAAVERANPWTEETLTDPRAATAYDGHLRASATSTGE
ncbi:MAG TPA: hypothetical protein VGP82_19980 [Ktedonobacterales bacterium]|nr:hypothetical protein [Ktedonobacterales bacterium]